MQRAGSPVATCLRGRGESYIASKIQAEGDIAELAAVQITAWTSFKWEVPDCRQQRQAPGIRTGGHSRGQTLAHMTQLIMPQHANSLGITFGGQVTPLLLSQVHLTPNLSSACNSHSEPV